MIAHQPAEHRARIRNPRAARTATQSRVARRAVVRRASLVQVSVAMGTVLVVLMSYVLLTSNLTGLTYAMGKAQREHEALLEESVRLDDRIAALRSDDRLASLAARMGMRDPQRVGMVRLTQPETVAARPRFAVLSSLAGLFMPAVPREH